MSDIKSEGPSRRDFIRGAVGAVGAVTLAACGGGGGTDAGPGPTPDAGTDAGGTDAGGGTCTMVAWELGSRHFPGNRHIVDIPFADVMAGVDQTYDITGDSDHPHTLMVTAADFARIAAGETVMIASSTDDRHDHLATLMCA